jgi:hypothetical protein
MAQERLKVNVNMRLIIFNSLLICKVNYSYIRLIRNFPDMQKTIYAHFKVKVELGVVLKMSLKIRFFLS